MGKSSKQTLLYQYRSWSYLQVSFGVLSTLRAFIFFFHFQCKREVRIIIGLRVCDPSTPLSEAI